MEININSVVFVRLGIFLFAGFFLFSPVSAGNSSSETEFNIAGCNFDFNGVDVGVSTDTCVYDRNPGVDGDYTGQYFCNQSEQGWETLVPGYGCTRGELLYAPDPLGVCCPPTSAVCIDAGSGLFVCEPRTVPCYENLTQTECEGSDVTAIYYDGKCICDKTQESCSVYNNKVACEADEMGVGVVGVGASPYCGGYLDCGDVLYTVPEEGCGCAWNPGVGASGGCENVVNATETFPNGPAANFKCSSSYDIAECVNGTRDINWTSIKGSSGNIPQECWDLLGCNDGSNTLPCGADAVKLPGFSLFSLLTSLLVIGIYYFISGTYKRKGGHAL